MKEDVIKVLIKIGPALAWTKNVEYLFFKMEIEKNKNDI